MQLQDVAFGGGECETPVHRRWGDSIHHCPL